MTYKGKMTFRKNSAGPEDRRRALDHRFTRGEGAGCVHNLGDYKGQKPSQVTKNLPESLPGHHTID